MMQKQRANRGVKLAGRGASERVSLLECHPHARLRGVRRGIIERASTEITRGNVELIARVLGPRAKANRHIAPTSRHIQYPQRPIQSGREVPQRWPETRGRATDAIQTLKSPQSRGVVRGRDAGLIHQFRVAVAGKRARRSNDWQHSATWRDGVGAPDTII